MAGNAEIERRIEPYDRGEVQAVDFQTAIGRIPGHLADQRSRKGSS